MSFEEGLGELERIAAERLEERRRRSFIPPAPADFLGCTFKPGDRVRDISTGEVGDVVAVTFENVLVPPSGREGD